MDLLFNVVEALGEWLAPLVISLVSLPILSLLLYRRPAGKNICVSLPSKDPTHSPRYRHYRAKDGLLTTPNPAIKTIHDLLVFAAREAGNSPMLGSRKLLRIHEEQKLVTKVVAGQEVKETKTWQYYELTDFRWITAKEALARSLTIGAGLVKLGFNVGDKACIYAQTCAEWRLFAHGCFSVAMTIATAYDTLGASGLLWSLNEPQIPVIFMGAQLIPTLTSIFAQTTHLKHVIYFGDVKPEHLDALRAAAAKAGRPLSLHTLEELEALGLTNPCPVREPEPESIACIMYTSGSTGNPKGVMLTHANIIAAIGGIKAVLNGVLTPNDCFLAFLPLAHILAFVVECYLTHIGIRIGYGSPKTLTSASTRNCEGDLATLKPTVIVGVPAVFGLISKGILAKVAGMSPLVQRVFWAAYKLKKFALFSGVPVGWIADALVFNKVKAQTGGRLRIALSGGAPIAEETQLFLSTVLAPIVQGYGATEGCGMAALYSPEIAFATKNVGVPVACGELKLVDVPEAGYFARANPPRGEVWVRGNAVMRGYYNQPELTRETLTEDGWLMTGDIAQFNPDGSLQIIDRKKNLVKLAHGEYIALEKLEAVYGESKYVARLCVYADSLRSYPIAIVQPVPAAIEALARAEGITFDSWEQLCYQKLIADAILADLKAVAKRNTFVPAEVVQAVVLADEEWTPQSGLLTAAMKLQRRTIVDRYKSEIEKAYK
ncbi:long-chain fatty acid-CoA ligase [Blastocladiella emersonii ATCC 22665]|nr:long-chain fatty acid-CoA ligase [Blastocladiella emersonii ATCC 22665]